MSHFKKVVVLGQEVEMELRLCADLGCDRHFWAALTSKQSICGTTCWEFVNFKAWHREIMPPVMRPGDEKLKIKPEKTKKHSSRLRQIIDQSWNAEAAKRRAGLKSEKAFELPFKS